MLSPLKSRLTGVLTIVVGVAAFVLLWRWYSGPSTTRLQPLLAGAWFQLGQGSGWHGLDTVKISADGDVAYEYGTATGWARKQFKVDAKAVESLKNQITNLRIVDLKAAYSKGVADGEQWVILITDDGLRKTIYCDNEVPKSVQELSEYVHRTIIEPHAKHVAESAVPRSQHRIHERELWDSIRKQ